MEKYTEINIDGETIIMELEDHRITIGNRFELNLRIQLNGTTRENKDKIKSAFHFFHNYAILFSRRELKKAWNCYVKADNQRSDNLRHAFWNYWDGKRIRRRGKSVFQWV
jgi:hypothetical protein